MLGGCAVTPAAHGGKSGSRRWHSVWGWGAQHCFVFLERTLVTGHVVVREVSKQLVARMCSRGCIIRLIAVVLRHYIQCSGLIGSAMCTICIGAEVSADSWLLCPVIAECGCFCAKGISQCQQRCRHLANRADGVQSMNRYWQLRQSVIMKLLVDF
jgi:hypothetical protein